MLAKKILKYVFLTACMIAANIKGAYAINIDEFEGDASLTATTNGAPQTQIVVNATAIGGRRSMYVRKDSGTGDILLRTVTGRLKHDQGNDDTGVTLITWDGDNLADSGIPSNPLGLGGIDLTEDNGGASTPADSFILKLTADLGFNQPVTLKIYVFSGPSSASVASVTINTDLSTLTDIAIPYANFTAVGSPGFTAATFTSVGAIVLEISGALPANDIDIRSIATNGECPTFPANGTVYSICNKCISDPNPNSCVDCAGVPNGTAKPGGPCDTGDVGVCADGTYESQLTFIVNQQNCSCKAKTTPSPEICDGLDNDCDGQSENGLIDVCGICGGNGKSCLDCAGTPFGTKVPDQCGICGGDGKSCLDCAGTPFGTKVPDQCGVCGGNNSSCSDCAGTPNGGKTVDQCGVCGGDGKSCIDCKGSVFGTATVDKCGVCGGDSTSCLDCRQEDITEDQFELDHGAKLHEKLIVRNLKTLAKLDKSNATKAYIKKTQATAHELQERNWVLSWTMKSVITICGNTTLCTQDTSNEVVLSEYTKHSIELRDLGKEVIARLAALKINTKKLIKSNEARHKANIGLASTVPTQFTIGCNL